MAQIKIKIPGFEETDGEEPIVILGPNGSGKTQLAQKIAHSNQVSAISAQRRIWINDNLPVQQKTQLRSQMNSQQERWRQHSWQPTEEIDFVLSTLVQDYFTLLAKRNDEAIDSGVALDPVRNTKLVLLQRLWSRLFSKRKLEFDDFFPKVKRLDVDPPVVYQLKEMSDGEKTVLYMAARVLTADKPIVLVDEPELHMHCRLSVQFWDEAERLRPDCRFIYVTHDLNFALSRRSATHLITRSSDQTLAVVVDEIPRSVVTEVLGAATLPFYAKRIFFFEGESGKGFASKFFSAWFDDDETFAIPTGNSASVRAAVSGLKAVGVMAAEVIGLIDRDFYSDEVLNAVPDGVSVLPLHEIESVLCDQRVVSAVAEHLGKNPNDVWNSFLDRVRSEYRGKSLSFVVANRVRSRVRDLLDGAFDGAQIDPDLAKTGTNHSNRLTALNLPSKTGTLFAEETKRVEEALAAGGKDMLAILPGKHILDMLAILVGFTNASKLASVVVQSLDRKPLKKDNALFTLGTKVETALLDYLPPRRAQN